MIFEGSASPASLIKITFLLCLEAFFFCALPLSLMKFVFQFYGQCPIVTSKH